MSLFQRTISPPRQAGIILAGAVAVMAGCWAANRLKIADFEPLNAWSIATASLLLFAIFNSVMSLDSKSAMKYWRDSVYCYLGLALLSALAAWLISGIAIDDAGSYRWLYMVVTFCFLVFLSMVNFMRRIVEFAEREEWNAPRKKNRGD